MTSDICSAGRAWLDESVRGVPGAFSYLLGGLVTCGIQEEQRVRAAMMALHQVGPKLHWRDMDARRRGKAAQALNDLGVQRLVAVCAFSDRRREERARSLCLKDLVISLSANGVTHVTLESRTRTQDRRDREIIAALHGGQVIPAAVRVETRPGREEPLL